MSKYAEDETMLAGIRNEETPDDIVPVMTAAAMCRADLEAA